MILYEYEGKKLFARHGIVIPEGFVAESADCEISVPMPVVLKAQVLSGKRADNAGIVFADSLGDARDKLGGLLGSHINGEKVDKVLVEEKLEFDKEYYLSAFYDTETRGPVVSFSEAGGTGIESRGAQTFPISLSFKESDFPEGFFQIVPRELAERVVSLFFEEDCVLVEINPLVKLKDGRFVALDAKVKLDDTASGRHPEWKYFARSAPGHKPTEREVEAKKIDEGDYRGTAGSAYFDLDGDIAVLASGGGVSLAAMDALIKFGGKPANYTEYSGNPPKEKVVKLTKIVLSKPNIHGLWVVGTAPANFTDIYETLSGFMEGIRGARDELGVKFDFPIVIRRGGPREKEAFEMLGQVRDFDLTLQGEETSIVQSAKVMVDLAKKYAIGQEE